MSYPGQAAQTKPQRWRNTFGAERRTQTRPAIGSSGINADVIALQGVRQIADVRRLFPARTYSLLVSRAVLLSLTSSQSSRPVVSNQSPQHPFVTAIAIRRQPGVRVVGNHNFVSEPPSGSESDQPFYAGLAVRLSVSRQPVWVTSVDLTRACGPDKPASTKTTCKLRSVGERNVGVWAKRTIAAQIPVVLTGTYAGNVLKRAKTAASKITTIRPPAKTPCKRIKPTVALVQSTDIVADGDQSISERVGPTKRPCVTLVQVRVAR